RTSMASPQEQQSASPLTLPALTAADFMTPNPVSIRQDATPKQAAEILADRGFSAAPVIDAAGRPVGVVSRSDLMIHYRNKCEPVPAPPVRPERSDEGTHAGEPRPSGVQAETAAPDPGARHHDTGRFRRAIRCPGALGRRGHGGPEGASSIRGGLQRRS